MKGTEMVNEKAWRKIAELTELQSEMFQKMFPDSDVLDEYESSSRELQNYIEEIRSSEPVDTVTAEVVNLLASRSHKGVRTYAMTMDREDLSMWEWMCHFREELADGLVYLTKMMRVQYEIEQKKQSAAAETETKTEG